MHVKKLKEVNGFKKHNLIVKENLRKGSPLIYINNPVESKIPNAFLSIEEFKTVLAKRGVNQRATVSNTNTTIPTKNYVSPKITSTTTLKRLIDNTNNFLNNDLSTKKAPITKIKINNIELATKGNILTNTTVPENINLTQNYFQSSVLVASKKQFSVTTIAPSKLSLSSKMSKNIVGSTENEKNVIGNEKSTKLLEISQRQQNLVEINNTTSLVNIISTQKSSIQTTNVSKREGPRRKKTTKFTSKSTLGSTKTKRTTLGVSIRIRYFSH